MTRKSNQLVDTTFTLTPPTPEQARKAGLFACESSTDLEDARLLVEALGIRERL